MALEFVLSDVLTKNQWYCLTSTRPSHRTLLAQSGRTQRHQAIGSKASAASSSFESESSSSRKRVYTLNLWGAFHSTARGTTTPGMSNRLISKKGYLLGRGTLGKLPDTQPIKYASASVVIEPCFRHTGALDIKFFCSFSEIALRSATPSTCLKLALNVAHCSAGTRQITLNGAGSAMNLFVRRSTSLP